MALSYRVTSTSPWMDLTWMVELGTVGFSVVVSSNWLNQEVVDDGDMTYLIG